MTPPVAVGLALAAACALETNFDWLINHRERRWRIGGEAWVA